MQRSLIVMRFASALIFALVAASASAAEFTPQQLDERLVERRAFDAVVWGVPAVNLDMMRQAYFRDANARYNDIIWWPKGADWRNQSLAANTLVRYIYFFADTRADGPIVFEIPAAVEGASFYGTIMDSWQFPVRDVGADGKAWKYLILPPGYEGEVPAGYTPLRFNTFGSYALVRSIVASDKRADIARADALVSQLKVYPLSKAGNPPAQTFRDMTGVSYEPAIPYDRRFFESLARIVNEEPAQELDKQMLGRLHPLGIEKGKAFAPDAATVAILERAGAEAQAYLLQGITRVTKPYWDGVHWGMPTAPSGFATTFTWRLPDQFDVDGRGITLANWFGPVEVLGKSSNYVATFFDSDGHRLEGQHSYRLNVPANVPVRDFWSITAYDAITSGLIRNAPVAVVSSRTKGLQVNADGSVDLYFGPKPPPGKASNWVHTEPGRMWFPWFRLYGPTEAFNDKSWKLTDFERIQ